MDDNQPTIPECDDHHHAAMNRARIQQSLPDDYLRALLAAAQRAEDQQKE